MNFYTFNYNGQVLEDEEMSRIIIQLLYLRPHESFTYTWDDIGIATLMYDVYDKEIRFCPQEKRWYIWDKAWVRQGENGIVSDRLETLLNLLLLYCKEAAHGADDEQKDLLDNYGKFIKTLRKFRAMQNILSVLETKCRMNLYDMDKNPYILNTSNHAYDLKTNKIIKDITDYNVTKKCPTRLPDKITPVCHRWEQFINEIMQGDKEKAAFLQRALGYSLLGINREECMFIAYGSTTRNGKGTLFSTIETVLGKDYADSAPTELICEKSNGRSRDFNDPQPALARLVGTRLVSMAESSRDVRLDAAAMKTMTGRDTLVTRGLYEASFSFVPQFTLWLNTNHLPAVTDDTVFSSNRIWVIEFNRHFDENEQDKDLKEIFSDPDNRPTILKWLYDGCQDYLQHGLNPPACVREATANYRRMHDRIGLFISETYVENPEGRLIRGDVYAAYRNWCCKAENHFHPIGSTTFYNELAVRGFGVIKTGGDWFVTGLAKTNN